MVGGGWERWTAMVKVKKVGANGYIMKHPRDSSIYCGCHRVTTSRNSALHFIPHVWYGKIISCIQDDFGRHNKYENSIGSELELDLCDRSSGVESLWTSTCTWGVNEPCTSLTKGDIALTVKNRVAAIQTEFILQFILPLSRVRVLLYHSSAQKCKQTSKTLHPRISHPPIRLHQRSRSEILVLVPPV
jgi:hypothetical protein